MLALFKFKTGTYVRLVHPDRLTQDWTQENIGFMKGGITVVEATAKPRDLLDIEYPSTAYGIVAEKSIIGSEAPTHLGTALSHINGCSQLLGSFPSPVLEGAFTFQHRNGVWAVIQMPNPQQRRALVFSGNYLNLRYTGAWTPSFEGLAEVVIFPGHNLPIWKEDLVPLFNEEDLKALGVSVKNPEGEPFFAEA